MATAVALQNQTEEDVLNLLLIGGLPTWSYSRRWRAGRGHSYAPSGVLGILLIIVIILLLTGRLLRKA